MTRGPIYARALRTLGAVAAGCLVGILVGTTSWAEAAAPPTWALAGSLIAIALAVRQAPLLPMTAYVATASLGLIGTSAVGSSWAATTWWPVILATVALGRSSRSFLLALTATVLTRDAAPLVVLDQLFGARSMSGSFQYFLGFVGAIAAPLWFRVASEPSAWWGRRILSAVAVLITALAVWAVLASGSRAAMLGLAAAAVASLLVGRLLKTRRGASFRSVATAFLAVAVLVPVIDVGLGYAFGSGGSLAVQAVTSRAESTVAEIERDGPSSARNRLAFWRQAATAVSARPLGHGPGSYAHVNHAYQYEPLLWSGSPHSVWALAAVETGLPGLIALAVLVIGGMVVALRRGGAAMAALLAGTAVMSLDVFSSMPVQSLVWWAAIGTAWGPSGGAGGRLRVPGLAALVVIVAISSGLALRLSSGCGDGCDPIVRYGGHPSLVGALAREMRGDPADVRWQRWKERYPMAFWLAHAEANARAARDPEALLELLRAYPYQAAQTYIDVSDALSGGASASDVASCGLARLFDGRPIWRDWRSSGAELAEQRAALVVRAGTEVGTEAACQRVAIPPLPIGLR